MIYSKIKRKNKTILLKWYFNKNTRLNGNADLSLNIVLIILNVNCISSLNIPNKVQRLENWIKSYGSTMYCLQGTNMMCNYRGKLDV